MAGQGTGVFVSFYQQNAGYALQASLRPGSSALSAGLAVWQDWLFGTPSGGAFTLVAAFAAFTFTGQAANLLAGHVLPAANATFTFTGKPASLLAAHRLVAANATFTFTGEPASLLVTHKLTAAFATFTFTGEPVSLNKGRTLVADRASFILTGEPVTFRHTYNLAAANATFIFNGQDATLIRHLPVNYLLLASTGIFVFVPSLVLLRKSRPLPPFDVSQSWSLEFDRTQFQLIAYNANNRQFLVILADGNFALWTDMPPTITGAIQYAKDKQLFLHNLTPPTIASYTP